MSLTDDWKAGQLHKRFEGPKLFYCETDDGIEVLKTNGYRKLQFLSMEDRLFEPDDDIKILAPVPSYEELQHLRKIEKKYANIKVNGNYPDKISKLKSRIKHLLELQANQDKEVESLRELLRECLAHLSLGEIGTSVTPLNILLCHIKAAIGESEE